MQRVWNGKDSRSPNPQAEESSPATNTWYFLDMYVYMSQSPHWGIVSCNTYGRLSTSIACSTCLNPCTGNRLLQHRRRGAGEGDEEVSIPALGNRLLQLRSWHQGRRSGVSIPTPGKRLLQLGASRRIHAECAVSIPTVGIVSCNTH